MNKEYKSGFVSIIGRPNVGKSTLMNRLIGQKIAITSNKAQTTRNRIQTVYTSDKGQIIFLDTPGINRAKTLSPTNADNPASSSNVRRRTCSKSTALGITPPFRTCS